MGSLPLFELFDVCMGDLGLEVDIVTKKLLRRKLKRLGKNQEDFIVRRRQWVEGESRQASDKKDEGTRVCTLDMSYQRGVQKPV